MADSDNSRAASVSTRRVNAVKVAREPETPTQVGAGDAVAISEELAAELRSRGIKGFKKGGTVRRTGIYKLHKGEQVIPAGKARMARAAKKARKA